MYNEQWLSIPVSKLEEYEISNHGNIRKFNYETNIYDRVRTFSKSKQVTFNLNINSVYYNYKVDKLVYLTFNLSHTLKAVFDTIHTNKKTLPFVVIHKDGNAFNNHHSNLELDITNLQYSITSGDNEVYVPIPLLGMEQYRISNLGNIQYLHNKVYKYCIQTVYNNLRLISVLNAKGERKQYTVANLVALSFLNNVTLLDTTRNSTNIPYALEVQFKDGCTTNVMLDNLVTIYHEDIDYIANKEEFRNIPIEGLEKYRAGNFGTILKYSNKHKDYVPCKQHSYSNNYRFIVAKDIQLDRYRGYSVHRLIGTAFHDWTNLNISGNFLNSKDGIPYVINHINGVKDDNRASNLEWVTTVDNYQHARTTGMTEHTTNRPTNNNVVVEVRDVTDNTTITYNSLFTLSIALEIKTDMVKAIIHHHDITPYKNRYLFKVISDDTKYNKDTSNDNVLVLDYVTRKVIIYDNSSKANIGTKVVTNTIKQRASLDIAKHTSMLAGYDFYWLKDIDMDNPPLFNENFSVLEAEKSRDKYYYCLDIGSNTYSNQVEVMDLDTNEVKTYPSLKKMCEIYDLTYTKWKQIFTKQNKITSQLLRVFDNKYVLRLVGDNRDWTHRM